MKILKKYLIIFVAVLLGSLAQANNVPEMRVHPMVVIIPSYNNIKWYKKNIDMLIAQDKTYPYWFALYVDDCSPDGTGKAVKEYVHEKGYEHKILVIQNEKRKGALANIYQMVHKCKDHMVIVTLDGDDWYSNDHVLYRINQAYQDPNVWLTYGQFEIYPNGTVGQCEAFPQEIIDKNDYRAYKWVVSHPRTFYAGLFKKINAKDFLVNGEFYPMAWDCAMMFPMLEMAAGRIKFIPDVLYAYNCTNPLNDFRVSATRQEVLARHIRALPKYQKLDQLFSDNKS